MRSKLSTFSRLGENQPPGVGAVPHHALMAVPVSPQDEQRSIDTMTEHFRDIIVALGEDADREGLLKTPERAAKGFYFLTRGYRQDISRLINEAVFTSDTDEMVIVRNIEMYSMCEHHMLPFIGKCNVAYLPNGKVLGLSKIARIVDFYARRLQIQEVLTKQIAECVQSAIGGKGVGVVIEAQHMCMMMRGVEKQNSTMTTSCMLGTFRSHPQSRNEFLRLLTR